MQTIELARERVCQSLLDRINVFDKMLIEAEQEDNREQARKIFKLQSNTLNRLEILVNH
jgi:hypothetical protein